MGIIMSKRIYGEEQFKIRFEGEILSIQPRSNVWRYLIDNRTHSLTGYNIFLKGIANETEKEFVVAISERQQMKCGFCIGDKIKGTGWTKKYPELEYADYYRAGALVKIAVSGTAEGGNQAPWRNPVPDLATYAWRGARMLDAKCWKNKCFQCKWAAMANVAIEYDFGVSQKHRFESFCYGPKNCKFYKMGRARAVPYKGRGSVLDEGWLDEICTENRNDEE